MKPVTEEEKEMIERFNKLRTGVVEHDGTLSIIDSVDYKEAKDFLLSETRKVREELKKKIIKSIPKERGFAEYGKHVHVYIHEDRGKCEICGLSWKKAGEFEIWNNAIITIKKIVKDSTL